MLTPETWNAWEPRFRAQFFNSLGGPRQVGLLTSFSPQGVANAAVFSQTLHVSANPPQLGFLFRPLTAEHQGLRYVRAQGCFGFHVLSGGIAQAQQLHQCSAKYPEGESELDAVGLSWEAFETLHAPRIHDAAVAYGLQLTEEHELANGTILIVGSVAEVHVLPSVAANQMGHVQHPDDLLLAQGLDTYHHCNALVALSYAQPGTHPKEL
jgi:flavin reductase (DIM6/NTAB) family NADH-FMN oxidoreductase RutF